MSRVIVVFSTLGIGVLSALAIAKDKARTSECPPGAIAINPTTTADGPAIRIEVGDHVFLVPSITVKDSNFDHPYTITVTTDGKLKMPTAILGKPGTNGTFTSSNLTMPIYRWPLN